MAETFSNTAQIIGSKILMEEDTEGNGITLSECNAPALIRKKR
jgi:hypothetical protein